MKELINSELEKHEIPKHEHKSMTESRKRKIEKNKQMLAHSKKVRDFLNKYYAGERTYTYLGKGENFPLDYQKHRKTPSFSYGYIRRITCTAGRAGIHACGNRVRRFS